jgi:hypothetical protein
MNTPCLRAIAIVLIASLLPWQCFAQGIPSPEIEASLYLVRAREELDCSPDDALHWLKKARSGINRLNTNTPQARDLVAGLHAKAEMLEFDIKARKKKVQRFANLIEKDLRAARTQTALENLARARVEAPTCDLRFREWQSEAGRRKARAIALDERVGTSACNDRQGGLDTLRSIRTINIEHPGLDSRIREYETARCAAGFGKKFAITVLVLAIAGGAAYGGRELFRWHQRRR